MQTYEASIICREPVANQFSCGNEDTITFSHLGTITRDSAEAVINDGSSVLKRCWKCFAQNWRVQDLKPLAYQSQAVVTRV